MPQREKLPATASQATDIGMKKLYSDSASRNAPYISEVLSEYLPDKGKDFIFQKHTLGYQVKLTGEAPKAAKFAGVNPNLIVFFCLGISGTLAGLAGIFEVTGQAGQITSSFNSGYGFTAIIVAFLGRLHPVGILLAALLMALTYIGGELAQFQLQLPAASIQLFQGMLLFFLLAADILVNYRVSRKRS